jgi:hypothetical protein
MKNYHSFKNSLAAILQKIRRKLGLKDQKFSGEGREMFSRKGVYLDFVIDMGLGNRIIHLASAMRISEEKGFKLRGWWLTEGMGANFDEIFELLPGVEITSVQGYNHLPRRLRKLRTGSWLWYKQGEVPEEKSSSYPDPLIGGLMLGTPKPGFKYYMQLDWITPNLQSIYIPYFKRIQFLPEHNTRIDEIYKNIQNSNVLGVHIRNAHDMRRKLEKGGILKSLSLENVLGNVQALIKDRQFTKIYLATDCSEYAQILSDHLGDIVISDSGRKYTRGSPDDVWSAVTDLGVLSKCNMLLLSYSSFGVSAWWLGGCPDVLRLDHDQEDEE